MIATTSTPAATAAKFIHQTNQHIFLTGKAGTGKTTFLREIISRTYKNTVVAAPTGIAAINAGGVTLHSLFQLPFGSFIPDNTAVFREHLKLNTPKDLFRNLQLNSGKRKLLQELELLIIDEVSMLRADLLDAIDTVLKSIRRNSSQSFGGVQVLFIGDLLQLPPVVKDDEWTYLKKYYATPYFFDARVLQQNKPLYIELDKIYRQQDDRFISILNNLRNNEVTREDIEELNACYLPDFRPNPDENYIHLTTHNFKADQLNREALQQLKGKSYFYKAEIEKDFSEYAYPVNETLELKKGAQVMFIKNDPSGARRYFNGKIGMVEELDAKNIEVKFEDGSIVEVEKYEWQNIKYKLNTVTNEIEENIEGTFKQFPIKLAWAITVHKSQGLTFDKAIVDIGNAFAPGQVYVALSRLTSMKGLILSSKIQTDSLLIDEHVSAFSSAKPEEEELQLELDRLSDDFFRKYITGSFDFSRLHNLFREFLVGSGKEEKRSAKAKHKEKLDEIFQLITESKLTAEKFTKQLHQLLAENNKEQLAGRILKAKEHFEKSLKQAMARMKMVMEEAGKEKRVREFMENLSDLDRLIFKQLQQLHKAVAITDSYLLKKDFTKENIHTQQLNQEKAADHSTLKDKKAKQKKEKRQKGDTYKLTYELYKSGLTMEEIAFERKLTPTTIAGHLATFVASGDLKAEDFVPQDKIEKILAASKKLDTTHFSPIKASLGDEYSYAEIRFVMAGRGKL